MPISGLAAAGAQESLEELLKRELLKEEQARIAAQQAWERTQRLDESRERRRQFDVGQAGEEADRGLRTRQLEATLSRQAQQDDLAAAARRQEANERGLVDMAASGIEQGTVNPRDPEGRRQLGALLMRAGDKSGLELATQPPPPTPEEEERQFLKRYEGQKQIEARYREPREEPMVTIQTVDEQGNPVTRVMPKSEAVGQNFPRAQTMKPPTGAERGALGFYKRAKEANETAVPLESDIAKMSLAGQTRLEYAPNFLQSREGQSYRQAQRAFTEARLRKESGAAIPPSEYDNDARTYFAQPGDRPETIKQKQAARKTVLESIAGSTGRAWEEEYGAPRERGGTGGGNAGPQVGEVRTINGVKARWDGKGWLPQ